MTASKAGKEGHHERTHFREAGKLFPDHHRRVSDRHSVGYRSADAARLVPGGQVDLHRGRPVHGHLRRVRDRACDPRHGDPLVLLRTGGHIDPDPDRRLGHCHRYGHRCHRLRTKDHAAAAEYASGEHRGVSCGRHPETDLVHLQGGPAGGTPGHLAAAAHVPLPLRPIRDMDGPVPLRVRLLQCGLRRDGRPYRPLFLPDFLQRPGGGSPARDGVDRHRRHWLFDLGRYGETSVPV